MQEDVNLDRPEALRAQDPGRMLGVTYHTAEGIEEIISLGRQLENEIPRLKFTRTIFLGTGGGSRAALDLLHSYLFHSFPYPFYIYQGYGLPGFVDSETLVFILSHSGETEESLSHFEEARRKTEKILVISAGGTLTRLAQEHGFFCFPVPVGMEARSAMPYLFFAALFLLSKQGIPLDEEEIQEAVYTLKMERELLKEEIPLSSNPAKTLALKLKGLIPFIYGSYGFSDALAERFRRQLAENAKTLAHANIIPNMHHDEIVGYEEKSLRDKVMAVLIRDFLEEKKIRKRFEVTKEVLGERGVPVLEVYPLNKGSKLARLFSLIQLLDYTSIYLALLRGFNPREVAIIKLLKERMKE
ncbi:MAG: bifunctional phosphoglucose/phosphomannose isomerase [Coprothermobacterota bacterium]|nr:bifunctional phosphoglucose/phosphomannose isomerase [Coprothermobacterota bacterium]